MKPEALTPKDLDEMEAQLDGSQPYYVLALIRALRDAWKQLAQKEAA